MMRLCESGWTETGATIALALRHRDRAAGRGEVALWISEDEVPGRRRRDAVDGDRERQGGDEGGGQDLRDGIDKGRGQVDQAQGLPDRDGVHVRGDRGGGKLC